ncbi:MAG TPA: FtsX-like permease family protein [Solirubrobacteraceae bacterium]|jgi:putative ABC transport system permease protein|nr:FtsX-like permease family protein [Solirubrobacteraceae bacterium]
MGQYVEVAADVQSRSRLMLKLVLRGFVQRKLRVLLTAVAIALGVALMAGTYILTDTINHAFAEVFDTAYANKAVVVTEKETLGGSEVSVLNQATLAQVRAVPGVAAASGAISSQAALLTTSGKRLTSGGAPGRVDALQPPRFDAFTATQGHLPRTAGEVAIDQASAKRNHLRLGRQIVIAGRSPARRYTIAGIAKFAGSESFGGTTVVILIPSQAQYVAGEPGVYDSINVAARPGTAPTELAARIRAVVPATLKVRTGAEEAANQTANLEEELGFLRTFLLIFAYVALVVGAFIIFNTISITVAQRTREFGLLRTLGASRGQIMRAVVEEGLLLGVVGAVIGLFGGIALAPALDGLFKAFGADLPDNGTVLEARTVIVSLGVGIAVTVLAGFFPALRATRVPPIAAMREGVQIPPRPLPTRRALMLRFALYLVVVVALRVVVGGGIALLVLVVLAVRAWRLWARLRRPGERPARHHRVVPALAGAIGWLVSWRGITARLARENSTRQPGRTLVTALALTVGLGLVAFISVLAAGTNATIDRAVSRSFAGNLIVQNTQGQGGIPAVVAPALRTIHGVGTVTAIAFTKARVRDLSQPGAPVIDEESRVTAIEPESFGKMYKIEWEHGSAATLAALGQRGTIVSEKFASAHHLRVGQRLSVLTPSRHRVTLTIAGVVKEEVIGLLSNLTISRSLARAAFGQREDGVDFVAYTPGADGTAVDGSIHALLRHSFPQAHAQTAAQYTSEQNSKVNQLLLLVYVLLALSVVVSLFGIVNTLVLSIYERTHELGMMRAIGTSRRQIRQMIRYESLITAMIGGVLGLAIGVVGAILVTTLALSGSGYVLSVPVGTLVVLLVVAALAGVLAAQAPARRAARLDILGALASE